MEEEVFTTQKKMVKAHLESGRSISPMEALALYGAFRLSAIIFDLKNDYGMDIVTEWGSSIGMGGRKKRFAVYHINKSK